MFSKFAILALGVSYSHAVKIEQKESSEFPIFVVAHRQPEFGPTSFEMQAPIHEAVIEMRPMFIRKPRSFGIDSMDDIEAMQSRMNHQFEHM